LTLRLLLLLHRTLRLGLPLDGDLRLGMVQLWLGLDKGLLLSVL
jgi:hypothetical protein